MRDHVSVTQSTAWIDATTPISGVVRVTLRSMDLTEPTQAHAVRATAPHETGTETLMAPPRLTATLTVTNRVAPLAAVTRLPAAALPLAAAALPQVAIVTGWTRETERMRDTLHLMRCAAAGVTLPAVQESRLGHLLW